LLHALQPRLDLARSGPPDRGPAAFAGQSEARRSAVVHPAEALSPTGPGPPPLGRSGPGAARLSRRAGTISRRCRTAAGRGPAAARPARLARCGTQLAASDPGPQGELLRQRGGRVARLPDPSTAGGGLSPAEP